MRHAKRSSTSHPQTLLPMLSSKQFQLYIRFYIPAEVLAGTKAEAAEASARRAKICFIMVTVYCLVASSHEKVLTPLWVPRWFLTDDEGRSTVRSLRGRTFARRDPAISSSRWMRPPRHFNKNQTFIGSTFRILFTERRRPRNLHSRVTTKTS